MQQPHDIIPRTPFARALQDLAAGAGNWRLWWTLAYFDIQHKYRRAIIGPFWISISMLGMTLALGLVYGNLLGANPSRHIPYVAAGLIGWYFCSTVLMESGQVFIQAERLIKQGGLPLSLHVFRLLARNVVVTLHNLVVMAVLYLLLWWVPWQTLWQLPVGLALTALNLGWMALILGALCARFRDLLMIVNNLVQLGFLITPVIYERGALGGALQWIAAWNPFYYLVEAIRGPLLGHGLPAELAGILALMALSGWLLALVIFAATRGRIAFWL